MITFPVNAKATDPRDTLWDAAYDTWYDSYYEEILAERLIARWVRLDTVTKLSVAVTSGGSAVASWALWKDPHFAWIWPTLTGVAALPAIITNALTASVKLRDHGDTLRAFATLRIELDTFRTRMGVNPTFDIATFEADLLAFRKRYSEAYSRIKSDVLVTRNLQKKCQAELDERIA